MRDLRQPVRGARRADPPADALATARIRAVEVARSAMAVFQERRWLPTGHATQAYQLAVQIILLEDELGAVCDADYAERHIRAMAEAAHLVVQHARHDLGEGSALISRVADFALVDGMVDDDLVPAYALVATTI